MSEWLTCWVEGNSKPCTHYHPSPPTFHSSGPTFNSLPFASTYLSLNYSHLYKGHQKKVRTKRYSLLKNDSFLLRDSHTLSFSKQVLVNLEWDWDYATECLNYWNDYFHIIFSPRETHKTYTIVLNKPLIRILSEIK